MNRSHFDGAFFNDKSEFAEATDIENSITPISAVSSQEDRISTISSLSYNSTVISPVEFKDSTSKATDIYTKEPKDSCDKSGGVVGVLDTRFDNYNIEEEKSFLIKHRSLRFEDKNSNISPSKSWSSYLPEENSFVSQKSSSNFEDGSFNEASSYDNSPNEISPDLPSGNQSPVESEAFLIKTGVVKDEIEPNSSHGIVNYVSQDLILPMASGDDSTAFETTKFNKYEMKSCDSFIDTTKESLRENRIKISTSQEDDKNCTTSQDDSVYTEITVKSFTNCKSFEDDSADSRESIERKQSQTENFEESDLDEDETDKDPTDGILQPNFSTLDSAARLECEIVKELEYEISAESELNLERQQNETENFEDSDLDEDETYKDPTDKDPTDGDPTDGDPTDGDPTDGDPTDKDPTDGILQPNFLSLDSPARLKCEIAKELEYEISVESKLNLERQPNEAESFERSDLDEDINEMDKYIVNDSLSKISAKSTTSLDANEDDVKKFKSNEGGSLYRDENTMLSGVCISQNILECVEPLVTNIQSEENEDSLINYKINDANSEEDQKDSINDAACSRSQNLADFPDQNSSTLKNEIKANLYEKASSSEEKEDIKQKLLSTPVHTGARNILKKQNRISPENMQINCEQTQNTPKNRFMNLFKCTPCFGSKES